MRRIFWWWGHVCDVVRLTIRNSKVDAARKGECANAVETKDVEYLMSGKLGAGFSEAVPGITRIGCDVLGSRARLWVDVTFTGHFLRLLLLAAEEGIRGPRHDMKSGRGTAPAVCDDAYFQLLPQPEKQRWPKQSKCASVSMFEVGRKWSLSHLIRLMGMQIRAMTKKRM